MQLTQIQRTCGPAIRPHSRLAVPTAPLRASRHRCRAENSPSPPEASQPQPAPPAPEQQQQQAAAPAAPSAPLLEKGQGTAIVTGAISVIFGLAYLVLVQLLDMRGGELQPPPPEAFIP